MCFAEWEKAQHLPASEFKAGGASYYLKHSAVLCTRLLAHGGPVAQQHMEDLAVCVSLGIGLHRLTHPLLLPHAPQVALQFEFRGLHPYM